MTHNEFEHQQKAYSNYAKIYIPELFWPDTVYKSLYDILQKDLGLTEASLGDYFLEQFCINIYNDLGRIENEVTIYAQNNDYDEIQKEHLFYHKSLVENRINELIQEYSSKKTKPIETPIKPKKELTDKVAFNTDKLLAPMNTHSEIFCNNGFELFNYILENHIKSKGKRGRYADLSFYYWEMYNSEEKYIHQRPEVFKNWFCKEYADSFEKIKTINEVNDTNGNRKKHYQTSLDWFKMQI